MRVAGLFAGIGGLERGLEKSGHCAGLLCEIAASARAVLDAHFPDAPKHADVTTLAALPGDTEIVAAGFPCQDLSQAGLTRGIGGDKSSLVGHVFRLIDTASPHLVILENVSFMLSLERGRAMATLVAALEARGFRWAYRVVNSLGFLPQRRERVYLVASRCDIEPADVLLCDDAQVSDTPPANLAARAHGFYWTEGVRGLGWAPDAVPTLKNGSTIGIPSPPAVLMPDGSVIKPDIRDAERLQGFPEDWTAPAERVARPSARWALVGNAVTVPAAEWLGARIARPGRYEAGRDRAAFGETGWPRAARGGAGARVAVEIGPFPERRAREPLHAFLRHPGAPLSARATRGFLARTERSTLRFAPGFLDALRGHLARMEAPTRMAAE
ncbi:DNA cytosine methyltransferase [Rubrimonas sp.]|uniref:DNA cytosine methyltransferase n=1 Tax=Rubrimonas sp. TaxID=2036015 RepID=UPI002FDCC3E1